MKKSILIFTLITLTSIFSQELSFVKLPFEHNDKIFNAKIMPQSNENKDTLICYYSYINSTIYHTKSFNKGKNWLTPNFGGYGNAFDIFLTNENQMVLIYLRANSLSVNTIQADGRSVTATFQVSGAQNLQIRKLGNGAGVFYSRLNKIYAITSNDLINWSLMTNSIFNDVKSFQILKLKNDKYFLAFTKPNENNLY